MDQSFKVNSTVNLSVNKSTRRSNISEQSPRGKKTFRFCFENSGSDARSLANDPVFQQGIESNLFRSLESVPKIPQDFQCFSVKIVPIQQTTPATSTRRRRQVACLSWDWITNPLVQMSPTSPQTQTSPMTRRSCSMLTTGGNTSRR